MVIHEMTREECLQVLAATRLARLACAFENQPYVVPVYIAYYTPPGEDASLCGFATPGQKIEWMRANPLVCIEVDTVESYDQWQSVIVLGHYEELSEPQVGNGERLPSRAESSAGVTAMPDTSGPTAESLIVHQVLQAKGLWWEPGATAWAARMQRNPSDSFRLVYYKVRIDQVTGYRATPDAHDSSSGSVAPTRKPSWLQSALTRLSKFFPS